MSHWICSAAEGMEGACPEQAKHVGLCHSPNALWQQKLQRGSGMTPGTGSGGREGGAAAAHRDLGSGVVSTR